MAEPKYVLPDEPIENADVEFVERQDGTVAEVAFIPADQPIVCEYPPDDWETIPYPNGGVVEEAGDATFVTVARHVRRDSHGRD